MKLNRDDVLQIVLNALKDAQQEIQGDSTVIHEGTLPIGDLKEFDSLASVMVTVHCLESLGYTNQLEFPSLFIDRRKVLTVGEVVDRLMELIEKK